MSPRCVPVIFAAVVLLTGWLPPSWLLTGGAVLAEPAGAVAPRSAERIARLVRQLGADTFAAREAATAELTEIGIAAKDALLEAKKHRDAEVRRRASRILQVILKADFARRLTAFADDVDDHEQLTLPGWEPYRQRVGDDLNTRELFVQMQRAEPQLMQAYAHDPERAAAVFGKRTEEIQQRLNVRLGDRWQVPLGSTAAMLLVASDPAVTVPGTAEAKLYSFVHQQPFRQGVMSVGKRPALRKLLGDWIAKITEHDATLGYQKVMVALKYGLSEGLSQAMLTAKQVDVRPYQRLHALLAIGKLGTSEHVPLVEPYLADDRMYTRRRIKGSAEVTIEVRDVALAVLVHLSGQDLKTYGLENAQPHTSHLFRPTSLYFNSESDRAAALAKWKRWAETSGRFEAEH